VYGIADEAGVPGVPITAKHYVMRRKTVPSWVSALPLNQWATIPGSNCETDLPSAIRNQWSGSEASGGANIDLNYNENPWMWSGMALRRKDSVLLFHGGGGSSGRQNGVLGFQLNAESPTWRLAMKPTAKSKCLPSLSEAGGTPTYNRTRSFNYTQVDLNNATQSSPPSPVAVHAYQSCTYSDAEDKWLRFGSQQVWPTDVAPGDSLGTERGTVFGFTWKEGGCTEADWQINPKALVPVTVGESMDGRHVLKNPWTEDFIIGANGRWHYYNAALNTWTENVQQSGVTTGKSGVGWEPEQNVAILTDSNGGVPVGLDYSAGSPRTVRVGNASSWGGPNGAEYAGSEAPWTWDDDAKCFWAVKAKASDAGYSSWDLFKIVLTDKATMQFTVTKVATTGTKPDFANVSVSLYDRVRYVPELGLIVVSTSYRRPMFAIRITTKA
jgi:hypothetical protein